jgi:NhaP-type Na+/H+ or K+/H+ antiporter
MYYYQEQYPWSWKFIVAEFFIIILGRFMAINIAYYMFNCFKGSPDNTLKSNEVSFLSYAAYIRGSIAFGLVQNIPESRFPKKRVVVSSVLVLVISSTMIIGSFTALFKRWAMPSEDT